jgi:transmembrane sensor
VAALAAAAAAAWLMIGRVDEHVTPVGGFERVPLADGSRVELNTDTAIEVAYSRNRRRVDLERGEAFFQVAKDARRPFVVDAGTYQVTAVGTAFSVRRDELGTEIVVTEGTVRVDRSDGLRPGRPLLVHAGAAAALGRDGPVVSQVSLAQVEGDLGWRQGVLVFADRPLREVAAEFNRYNRRQLVVVDPEVGNVLIAGRFRPTNLDGLVRLLEPGFGVEAVPQGSDRILLKFSAE